MFRCVYIRICTYICVWYMRMDIVRIAGMSMVVHVRMFRCVYISIWMYICLWHVRTKIVRIAGMSMCVRVCLFRYVHTRVSRILRHVVCEDENDRISRYVNICL